MKRKLSFLLAMVLMLSTLTNVALAEDAKALNTTVETTKATIEATVETENKVLELSMDEAVKLATENDRGMWKIDDGIKQAQDARKSGKSEKEIAEDMMAAKLGDPLSLEEAYYMNNYVSALLAKNGYYITLADTQMKQLEKSRELLVKGIEIEAKSLYYSVLLAEKAIEINNAKLVKSNEQLRVVNLKFNSGSATKAEVLNAEMAVQQTKTELDSAMDDLNMSKLDLLNKLDLSFDQEISLTDKELVYVPTADIDLNARIEKAKRERPEILEAENALELQKIETHAYTAYYTSNLRQHKSAKEKLKDAELNVPQAYKNVELDVRKSYLNLVKAERALVNMDKTVELAKEAARINKLLYNNGMATSLDVLDADTNLAQAEIGRYQLLAAYNISKLMFDNSNFIGSGMK